MSGAFINGWTKQSTIEHLKKEFKGYSYNLEKGLCMYRGPNGTKCAIGCFIPDDAYNSAFEQSVIRDLIKWSPELLKYMPIREDLLQQFQGAHDNSSDKEYEPTLQRIVTFIESLPEEPQCPKAWDNATP